MNWSGWQKEPNILKDIHVFPDDDATILSLSKDAINTKKSKKRAHRSFFTYLKYKNYGDVNFENWSPEMLSLPCHSWDWAVGIEWNKYGTFLCNTNFYIAVAPSARASCNNIFQGVIKIDMHSSEGHICIVIYHAANQWIGFKRRITYHSYAMMIVLRRSKGWVQRSFMP